MFPSPGSLSGAAHCPCNLLASAITPRPLRPRASHAIRQNLSFRHLFLCFFCPYLFILNNSSPISIHYHLDFHKIVGLRSRLLICDVVPSSLYSLLSSSSRVFGTISHSVQIGVSQLYYFQWLVLLNIPMLDILRDHICGCILVSFLIICYLCLVQRGIMITSFVCPRSSPMIGVSPPIMTTGSLPISSDSGVRVSHFFVTIFLTTATRRMPQCLTIYTILHRMFINKVQLSVFLSRQQDI